MQSVENGLPPAVFVVVLREFLVARDIEMIIRSVCSEAMVILARTLEDAVSAMPAGRIMAAFVQMDAESFAQSDLSRRVASDGGRTILVGLEREEALPSGWATLPFPFAETDVSALLAGWVPRCPKPVVSTVAYEKAPGGLAGDPSGAAELGN